MAKRCRCALIASTSFFAHSSLSLMPQLSSCSLEFFRRSRPERETPSVGTSVLTIADPGKGLDGPARTGGGGQNSSLCTLRPIWCPEPFPYIGRPSASFSPSSATFTGAPSAGTGVNDGSRTSRAPRSSRSSIDAALSTRGVAAASTDVVPVSFVGAAAERVAPAEREPARRVEGRSRAGLLTCAGSGSAPGSADDSVAVRRVDLPAPRRVDDIWGAFDFRTRLRSNSDPRDRCASGAAPLSGPRRPNYQL